VRPRPDDFLPLRAVEYHVLLALADVERHGYAIMQETAERTQGEQRLDPATLYRALRRMEKEGLVVESTRRRDPAADDERRRYYRVTPLGRQVALRETERLENLVRAARRTRLLRPSSGS
jgi:DNA-binding PadR family transcriptional regulator